MDRRAGTGTVVSGHELFLLREFDRWFGLGLLCSMEGFLLMLTVP
jgi:hypothetical protein